MKLLNKKVVSRSTIIMIAVFLLAGCASTGMQRSQDTRTTMETMDNDIQEASQQLDATGESLDELMRSGQTNVKSAFDSFKKNVEKMESIEKKFAKHAEQMKAKGIDYFKEWKKEGSEYKNPEIQRLSNERRAALKEVYDKIAENSIGVNKAFKAYISDIKEIRQFLSNDLTTKGIEAISQISERVVSEGNSLKYAIQDLQTAIQKAQSEMAQAGTN